MDHILQRVIDAHGISLLDGYSGYNQIAVCKGGKEKTAFTTPWGKFMYDKMPFGLMNAGGNFLEGHGHTFCGKERQIYGYILG